MLIILKEKYETIISHNLPLSFDHVFDFVINRLMCVNEVTKAEMRFVAYVFYFWIIFWPTLLTNFIQLFGMRLWNEPIVFGVKYQNSGVNFHNALK
jgi:hypothetical protein